MNMQETIADLEEKERKRFYQNPYELTKPPPKASWVKGRYAPVGDANEPKTVLNG